MLEIPVFNTVCFFGKCLQSPWQPRVFPQDRLRRAVLCSGDVGRRARCLSFGGHSEVTCARPGSGGPWVWVLGLQGEFWGAGGSARHMWASAGVQWPVLCMWSQMLGPRPGRATASAEGSVRSSARLPFLAGGHPMPGSLGLWKSFVGHAGRLDKRGVWYRP